MIKEMSGGRQYDLHKQIRKEKKNTQISNFCTPSVQNDP